jgi:DNA-3-methyladenine glycosylase
MKRLPKSFYKREDLLQISKELLGKIVVTKWNGSITSGRIVECEAYHGEEDRASHAYGGRRTNRTEVMFAEGGVAYVYLCYGIHQMFNVVTNFKNIPHAILIRALEPLQGIEIMLERTGKSNLNTKMDYTVTKGPGNLTKALGIKVVHTGLSLQSKELYIADDGFTYSPDEIASSPRIGVDYAGKDAKLKYRFFVKGNLFVSGRLK